MRSFSVLCISTNVSVFWTPSIFPICFITTLWSSSRVVALMVTKISNLPVTSEIEIIWNIFNNAVWISSFNFGSLFIPTTALTFIPKRGSFTTIVDFWIKFLLYSRLILLYRTDELVDNNLLNRGTEILAFLQSSDNIFMSKSSNFCNI